MILILTAKIRSHILQWHLGQEMSPIMLLLLNRLHNLLYYSCSYPFILWQGLFFKQPDEVLLFTFPSSYIYSPRFLCFVKVPSISANLNLSALQAAGEQAKVLREGVPLPCTHMGTVRRKKNAFRKKFKWTF